MSMVDSLLLVVDSAASLAVPVSTALCSSGGGDGLLVVVSLAGETHRSKISHGVGRRRQAQPARLPYLARAGCHHPQEPHR